MNMDERFYDVFIWVKEGSCSWDDGRILKAPSAEVAICRVMQRFSLTEIEGVQAFVSRERRWPDLTLHGVVRTGDSLTWTQRNDFLPEKKWKQWEDDVRAEKEGSQP